MNDDMSNKIKQIVDLLGQEGGAESVKSLLDMLSSGVQKDKPSTESRPAEVSKSVEPISEEPERKQEYDRRYERPESDDSTDILRKLNRVMGMMNTRDDPRSNLLSALTPYLNQKRQKKLGMYLKTLQMSRLISSMNEFSDRDNR